jgi:hypothetical protein
MSEQFKIHWGIEYRFFGEKRNRSLCGRSSGRVMDVRTLDVNANVTNDPKEVTCSFCRRALERRPDLVKEPHP